MIKDIIIRQILHQMRGRFNFEAFEREKYDYHRGIWLLKEKWRKKNCLFGKETGRWRYVDEN